MPTHGRYTKIWIDEFDFSGDSMGLETTIEAPAQDVTPFQASGKQFINLWPGMEISQQGYVNDVDDNQLEKAIHTRLGAVGATYKVAALYGTDVAGCPAYVLPNAFAKEMKIKAPVAGVLAIDAVWNPGSGTTGGLRGYRVADGSIAATGALTGVDFGAAGSAGGYAFLWVRSITGSASGATIKVQSDSDVNFGTAADEGTFTFSAIGSYVITLSGAIGRYVRLNCTSKGGATSFVVGSVVCVSGVSY